MAIIPQHLLDSLYGFDLGNMGAPVEPAVPGNFLPYLIDSEYPVQQGSVLAIPPEVVAEDEIAATDPEVQDDLIPYAPEDPTGGDPADAWPGDDFWSNVAVSLPDPNPARQGRMSDVQNAGNTQAAIDNDEMEEPEAAPVDLSSIPAIGFGPEDTTYSPEEYSEPGAPDLSPAAGAQASVNDGVQDAIDVANYADLFDSAQVGAIHSNPGVTQTAGIQNAGSIEDQAAAGVNAATAITGTPVGGYAGYGADLSARNADEQAHNESQQIANEQIANQQVQAIALNNMIGNDMLAEMAGRRSDSQLAHDVQNSLSEIAAAQQVAEDNRAADQLAAGMAGATQDVGRLASFSAPGLAGALASNQEAPASVQAASFTGPQGRSLSPISDSSFNFAPGLASTIGNLGSIEDQASLDLSSRSAPGTNPGNVGSFGSRGLGVGVATQAAQEASDRADRAESEASAARAENARAAGFAPGLSAALGTSNPAGNRGSASLSNMSDKSSPASLSGLDSKLGLSQLSLDRNVGTFASDLFGGVNKSKAAAFNNPAVSLHSLTGQELSKDTYNPYAGTNFAPLGSQVTSFSNTNPLGKSDIMAEVDAMNLAGNINDVNINSYNMHTDPYGQASPQSNLGTIGFEGDDEEDDDSVGGFSDASYSPGTMSGVSGISVGSSAGIGGFSGSDTSTPFGGAVGNFGFSADSSAGGFGSDSLSFSSASGGFGFSPASNGISVGGFGDVGGFGGFGGGGFSGGGIGGDGFSGGFSDDTSDSFSGGSTSGVGGSSGSQSDDTGVGVGNSQGNDGGFSGFSGFSGGIGDALGDGGFT